jgi:beta-galactosidase GanA
MHRFALYFLTLLACAGLRAADDAEGKTKVILDFEDPTIWTSENNSPFSAVPVHATQGAKALKVQYTNKPEWSNVLTQKLDGEWSGFGYLSFDLFLEGEKPVEFGMWIRDKSLHKAEANFLLGPGPNTLTVSLDELKRTGELDRGQVIALCLFKNCPEEITVYLDNLRVSEKAPKIIEATPIAMDDAERVVNGGFEETQAADAAGGVFKGWHAKRWNGAGYAGPATVAFVSGTSAAMLDGRDPTCQIGYFSDPIAVKYPSKVKLTAYVQAAEVVKGIEVCLTDTGDRPIAGAATTLPGGSYAWKKVEIVADLPNKCAQVKIFAKLNGAGRAWIDDVSLKGTPLDTKTGVTITDTGKELKSDPPIVTEKPEIKAKRDAALNAVKELADFIPKAKAAGVETLYDEIPLLLSDLAFKVRWDIPEHAALREGYCAYVEARAKASVAHLQAIMDGKEPNRKVPPHPDFSKLKLKGRYFCEGDEPRILFSMQYHRNGELMKWFCPEGYESYVASVGASRYDFQRMPIWEAYQKYPETHRVYDDGWCGHIIRDKYSDGGTDRCVINLDSPRMLEAVAKSIGIYGEAVKKRREAALIVNMGFEYSYVDYSAFSLEKFRNWLKSKHGQIAELNKIWKTDFKDFADVSLPSYNPLEPETNPAKYYDWGEFNLWRFTDFMKWAKGEIRKSLPEGATCTGGGEPFGAGFWRQGIDEEGLLREGVDDIFLSETGSRALGVTSVMDLQRSLSAEPRLILDPEYHALPHTCFQMFLHGCGVMDYWWWPDTMEGFYDSSMKHSHLRSLAEVSKLLEIALDVRRLPQYIAPFPAAQNEVALLYSRASLVQRFPAAQGHKTPYTLEVEKTYAAAASLDAPVGFISSRQVREGIPASLKVIIVPGVRFMEEDVFKKLTDWVQAGGTLIVTPTSLIADEYNRKRDYLKTLGLEITSEELPEFMAGEAKRGIEQTGELDFIQGPVAKTVVTKEPTRKITYAVQASNEKGEADTAIEVPLEAAGVIQTVTGSADWKSVCSYQGQNVAAVLTRKLGKGSITYWCAQLTLPSRRVLIEDALSRSRVARPIRLSSKKLGDSEGVESRTVEKDGNWLTYVTNTNDKAVEINLNPSEPIGEIYNVIAEKKEASPVLQLEPMETRILRIERKK